MMTQPAALSRRGFLRSLGVTACSIAVPGLWLPRGAIAGTGKVEAITDCRDGLSDDPGTPTDSTPARDRETS